LRLIHRNKNNRTAHCVVGGGGRISFVSAAAAAVVVGFSQTNQQKQSLLEFHSLVRWWVLVHSSTRAPRSKATSSLKCARMKKDNKSGLWWGVEFCAWGIIVGGTYLLEGKEILSCASLMIFCLFLFLSLCAHWPTILRTSARTRPRFYKVGRRGEALENSLDTISLWEVPWHHHSLDNIPTFSFAPSFSYQFFFGGFCLTVSFFFLSRPLPNCAEVAAVLWGDWEGGDDSRVCDARWWGLELFGVVAASWWMNRRGLYYTHFTLCGGS
jgi:hypothetical protein